MKLYGLESLFWYALTDKRALNVILNCNYQIEVPQIRRIALSNKALHIVVTCIQLKQMDTKTVLLNSLSLTETYYQPKVMQG